MPSRYAGKCLISPLALVLPMLGVLHLGAFLALITWPKLLIVVIITLPLIIYNPLLQWANPQQFEH